MRGWGMLALGIVLGLGIAVGVKFLTEETPSTQGSNSEIGRYQVKRMKYEPIYLIEIDPKIAMEDHERIFKIDTATGEMWWLSTTVMKGEGLRGQWIELTEQDFLLPSQLE